MYLSYTVLALLFVLPLLNLIILFFVSAFLVRFRMDLMSFFTEPFPPKVTNEELDLKPKTWDEKYEEEVELISKRLRQSANGDL